MDRSGGLSHKELIARPDRKLVIISTKSVITVTATAPLDDACRAAFSSRIRDGIRQRLLVRSYVPEKCDDQQRDDDRVNNGRDPEEKPPQGSPACLPGCRPRQRPTGCRRKHGSEHAAPRSRTVALHFRDPHHCGASTACFGFCLCCGVLRRLHLHIVVAARCGVLRCLPAHDCGRMPQAARPDSPAVCPRMTASRSAGLLRWSRISARADCRRSICRPSMAARWLRRRVRDSRRSSSAKKLLALAEGEGVVLVFVLCHGQCGAMLAGLKRRQSAWN